MAIENTSLMNEVNAIFASGNTFVHHAWRVEFRVNNEQVLTPLKLVSIDVVRDYVNGYADELFIEVIFGLGTFTHVVYPNHTKLEAVLIREPIGELSNNTDLSQDIDNQFFTCVLIDAQAAAIEANELSSQSQTAGDLIDLKYVKFQLVDKAIEQLRMQSIGGVVRETSVAEYLKYILTSVSQAVELEQEDRVQGVDMVEPNNTEIQKHIVVPHGTRFVDLPDYLMQKCAGIYNAGLGVYLQHKTWYVYPTYDLERFDKARKTLTLINVPKRKMPQVERTFRTTANQVIALVTGEVKHQDTSEKAQLNDGNGVRFTDARKMMEGFSSTENNRTMILRAENNNEYIATERNNKLNNVHVSPARITSNPFKEASRLAARNGSNLLCVWENSDPGLIFPGMPVKFMYEVNDEIYELTGQVRAAHTTVSTQQAGFSNRRHITMTTLLLFLDNAKEWGEQGEESDES